MFFLSPLPPLTRVCLLGVAPNASEAPHWKSALSLARKNLTHFFFFTISWLHIYGVYIPRNIFHKKRNGSPTTRHALFGRFSHKKRPVMAEMWHSDNKACLNGGGFPPFREACQVTNVVFQRYWLNKISLAKEPSQPENLFFSDEKKKKRVSLCRERGSPGRSPPQRCCLPRTSRAGGPRCARSSTRLPSPTGR